MTRIPGRSVVTSGACAASTPKSPSEPGTSTWLTSPENRTFSGETRSKWKVAMLRFPFSRSSPVGPSRGTIKTGSLDGLPGRAGNHAMNFDSRGFRRELLALLHGLLDGADHVERRLRQIVVFSFAQTLEASDGIGELDDHAGRAGEHFGDMEGL